MPADPLTPAELAELREAEAKMTKGTWEANGCQVENEFAYAKHPDPDVLAKWPHQSHPDSLIIYDEGGHSEEDATGIALMRNAFPRLLATIEALTAERDRIAEDFKESMKRTMRDVSRPHLEVMSEYHALEEAYADLRKERDALRREVEELKATRRLPSTPEGYVPPVDLLRFRMQSSDPPAPAHPAGGET